MLDLTTLVVLGQVHNLSVNTVNEARSPVLGKPLRILAPSLSGLLASARVTVGGVEVSSCNYIARTEHMLGIMQTDSDRRRDYAEGFGLAAPAPGAEYGDYKSEPIPPNRSRDVVWRPRAFGILDMSSLLPISLVPIGSLVIELTLADSREECCDTGAGFDSRWNVSQFAVHSRSPAPSLRASQPICSTGLRSRCSSRTITQPSTRS
jgi:hypothetical protein